MRRFLLYLWSGCLVASACFATIFGTVRGIVHDPQHRPVADTEVVLKAKTSAFTKTTRTNANGEFQLDAVPVAEYTITVSGEGFTAAEQTVTVLSGTAPILHFELQLASQTQSVTVSAAPAQSESMTPTNVVSREDIQLTPGGTRTNSLAMITNNVPGAYMTHDQLHVRGGHQLSWLVDGVAIPNTNIASNIGPQIDPKDIDTVELQRGSYTADFGDRTYGVFNVAPRTGFERNSEAEIFLGAGSFYQTDDQLSFGGHTHKFAYYGSINGNRTNLGLETPTPGVEHDLASGYGGFGSIIDNMTSVDQLRFVTQLRHDFYQVPVAPAAPFQRDVNPETDIFTTFSWVHTFNPGVVMTISPFYHYNRANYESDPRDLPSSTTQKHGSNYEGGQTTVSWIAKQNNLRAGIYAFAQQDDELFGLVYNDGSNQSFDPSPSSESGSLIAIYGEDQFRVNSFLTLNAGLRQTHFSGGVVENAASPRIGASFRVPKLHWVFRGFYGHFYQAPPLATVLGPLLQFITNVQQLTFVPLDGERDEEHQFGVTIPFKGWTLDADNFRTRANNYFDHNNFDNSNFFLPVTIQRALIQGWELTLRSPRLGNRAQTYVTYSNQLALASGNINGGLTNFSFGNNYAFLDHDQRNTLHFGGNINLPWGSFASADVYNASGFTNGDAPPGPSHLPGHTTFDMTIGKSIGERISLSVSGINIANRRELQDNSFTFGGTHYLNPREIVAQLRYRFHY